MNRFSKSIMAVFLSIALFSTLISAGVARDLVIVKSMLSITVPHLRNNNSSVPTTAYIISGKVGVAGATLRYGSISVMADSSGNYSIAVSRNWSGTVTPTKACYTFSPPSITYSRVRANQNNQDYIATPIKYAIYGNTSVGEVVLSYTDGIPKSVNSDEIGDYSFRVSCNWSGTVTPSKNGYTFDPANYSYALVKSDQPNQNYSANHIPTNIEPSLFNVAESLPSPAEVGTFTTTDLDTNDIHTYSFVENATHPDNLFFQITGNSLQTNSAFDFEKKPVYSIEVQTNDGHHGTYREEIIITVTDVNEPPTDINLEPASIVENSEIGTTIGAFTTMDEDTEDSHTYLLTNGNGCIDNAFFQIDNDHLIIANDISDYDDKPNYAICIRSTDGGDLFYDEDINIEVIPTFQISGSTEITGYSISYSGTYPHNGKPIPWSGSINTLDKEEYILPVPKSWTGTVTPSEDGYDFVLPEDPTKTKHSRRYDIPVLTDQTNQDFIARPIISGNVGIGGAKIRYDDDGPKYEVSNPDGTYSLKVSYCWYGPITPTKTDYTFKPLFLTLPLDPALPCVKTPVSGIDLDFSVKLNSPSIESPKHNSTVFVVNPTFKWKKMASIKYYKLSVKDVSAGTVPVPARRVTCNESPCLYTPTTPLTIGNTHELCVFAQDERGKFSIPKCIKFFVGFNFTFSNSSYQSFWTERPGADWIFAEVDEYIYTTGKANNTSSISYNKTFKDFAFEAQLWPSSGIANGLIVRGSPSFTSTNRWNTAYYFQFTPSLGSFKVFKYLKGVVVWQTAPIPIPDDVPIYTDNWNTLKVNAYQNNLTFYINRKQVYYREDTENPIYFGQVAVYMFNTGKLEVDNAKLLMPVK